jgi:transcriptional regulator with XRE-family HTH domain
MPRRPNPRIVSPLALAVGAIPDDDSLDEGSAVERLLWGYAPTFGAYLAKCREDANLSTRAAAAKVGISHTWLAQLEQFPLRSMPEVRTVRRLARLYGVDERAMLHELGVRYELPEDVAEEVANLHERRFTRLMLHDRFRPDGFTEDDIAKFPPAVMAFVVDFAKKVDANARDGGPTIAAIFAPKRRTT